MITSSVSEAKNFPRTISVSVTGEVISSSIVPRLRSSAYTPIVSIGVRNSSSVDKIPKKFRTTSAGTSIAEGPPNSSACSPASSDSWISTISRRLKKYALRIKNTPTIT